MRGRAQGKPGACNRNALLNLVRGVEIAESKQNNNFLAFIKAKRNRRTNRQQRDALTKFMMNFHYSALLFGAALLMACHALPLTKLTGAELLQGMLGENLIELSGIEAPSLTGAASELPCQALLDAAAKAPGSGAAERLLWPVKTDIPMSALVSAGQKYSSSRLYRPPGDSCGDCRPSSRRIRTWSTSLALRPPRKLPT